LLAFEQAGADVLYAPGLRAIDEIRTVREAVTRPINVLALPALGTVREVAEAGAQRISVGGQLTWVAVQALVDAATTLRSTGDLGALATSLELDPWLA
jgi:2-methylisocitrate lyase-like PEP mutase family enzyme